MLVQTVSRSNAHRGEEPGFAATEHRGTAAFNYHLEAFFLHPDGVEAGFLLFFCQPGRFRFCERLLLLLLSDYRRVVGYGCHLGIVIPELVAVDRGHVDGLVVVVLHISGYFYTRLKTDLLKCFVVLGRHQ